MILYLDKVRFLCRSTDLADGGEVTIRQDGSVEKCRAPQTGGRFLAKSLLHLGLLTPEVEAALKVSVTAHEKLSGR